MWHNFLWTNLNISTRHVHRENSYSLTIQLERKNHFLPWSMHKHMQRGCLAKNCLMCLYMTTPHVPLIFRRILIITAFIVSTLRLQICYCRQGSLGHVIKPRRFVLQLIGFGLPVCWPRSFSKVLKVSGIFRFPYSSVFKYIFLVQFFHS